MATDEPDEWVAAAKRLIEERNIFRERVLVKYTYIFAIPTLFPTDLTVCTFAFRTSATILNFVGANSEWYCCGA